MMMLGSLPKLMSTVLTASQRAARSRLLARPRASTMAAAALSEEPARAWAATPRRSGGVDVGEEVQPELLHGAVDEDAVGGVRGLEDGLHVLRLQLVDDPRGLGELGRRVGHAVDELPPAQ